MEKQLRDKRRGPLLQAKYFFLQYLGTAIASKSLGGSVTQPHAGAPFFGNEPHFMRAEPQIEDLSLNNPGELQALCSDRKMATQSPPLTVRLSVISVVVLVVCITRLPPDPCHRLIFFLNNGLERPAYVLGSRIDFVKV